MYKTHKERNHTDICYITDHTSKEQLHVIEIGRNSPPPGYNPSKMYRNCYVIHYVLSGKLNYHGKDVVAPCMFLMVPDEVHYFKVTDDPDQAPLKQYWIKFAGNDAKHHLMLANFPTSSTAFPCPEIQQACDLLQELLEETNYIRENDAYYALSALFRLFSLHIGNNEAFTVDRDKTLVQTIRNYIRDNYNTISNEEELSSLVHLSTCQMYKIFKKETGTSPMRYLNEYRIRTAKSILVKTDHSINEIAETLGFSDPGYFCRVFQRYSNGMSPTAYRKEKTSKS